jgi:hypothetical protein
MPDAVCPSPGMRVEIVGDMSDIPKKQLYSAFTPVFGSADKQNNERNVKEAA